jgi:hypothetical protein
VAGAGGVIHATVMDRDGRSDTAALAEVDRIGATVTHLLTTAAGPASRHTWPRAT